MTDIVITEHIPPQTVAEAQSTAAWEDYLREHGNTYTHPENGCFGKSFFIEIPTPNEELLNMDDTGSFLSGLFRDEIGNQHDLSLFESFWRPVLSKGQDILGSNTKAVKGIGLQAVLTELTPGLTQIGFGYHIDDSIPRYDDGALAQRISDRLEFRGMLVNQAAGTFIVPPTDQELAIIERHGYIDRGEKGIESIRFHQEALHAEALEKDWIKTFPEKTITLFPNARGIHNGGTAPEGKAIQRLLLNLNIKTDAIYAPQSRFGVGLNMGQRQIRQQKL